MPTYTYRARSSTGQIVSGVQDAPDQSAAAQTLREQGFWVTELQPQRQTRPQSGEASGERTPLGDILLGEANPKALSLFYRQLAAMMGSGMGVIRSMEMAANGATGRLKRAAQQAVEVARDGLPISQTLAPRSRLFGRVAVALLQAGETSGGLETMLHRAADHYEKVWKWRQKARRAMVYPAILLLAGIFIPSIPVLVLQGPEAYIRTALVPNLLTAASLIVGYFALKFLLFFKVPGLIWDHLVLAVPTVGKHVRKAIQARFIRTFADLYDAGTGPVKALEVAAETCGNRAISAKLLQAGPRLQSGELLTEAFTKTHALSPVALQMLTTGEMSGSVGESLNKVADYMEEEVETASDGWIRVLPILLWAIVAIPMILQIVNFWSGYANDAVNFEP